MNARRTVVYILGRFDERRGGIESLIDRALDRVALDHRDRRFVFDAVNGILRNRIRIRYTINHFFTDKRLSENDDLMRPLELGVYQLLYQDRVPDHAAVNETVNIVKGHPRTARYAALANAVLRAIINARGQVPLPDPQRNLALRLAVEYSHPVWMVQRWLDNIGLSATRKLLAYNNRIPETFLRRKMRGISRQQFETDSRGLCEPVPSFNSLYYRLTRKGMSPDEMRLFQLGCCTVQAPSAGWVVAMLDLHPGQRVLDVCSAPGGKAGLIAEQVGERGSVCACDISLARLRRVLETAERMQLPQVYPVVCDGRHPPFAGFFDAVLLDAPCTGTGVLQRHPDGRIIRTEEDLQRMAVTQESLLDAAAGLVGNGGVVVYATCSLEPEENEQQVERFLQRHPDFLMERPPRGITTNCTDLKGRLRITPHEHDLDGAFAARLRKK
jgi:16S rRNA (cytosine967-C5)-methyltransferase